MTHLYDPSRCDCGGLEPLNMEKLIDDGNEIRLVDSTERECFLLKGEKGGVGSGTAGCWSRRREGACSWVSYTLSLKFELPVIWIPSKMRFEWVLVLLRREEEPENGWLRKARLHQTWRCTSTPYSIDSSCSSIWQEQQSSKPVKSALGTLLLAGPNRHFFLPPSASAPQTRTRRIFLDRQRRKERREVSTRELREFEVEISSATPEPQAQIDDECISDIELPSPLNFQEGSFSFLFPQYTSLCLYSRITR